MRKPLPIYLHTLRKRAGLSQRELAFLLRISSGMLSKLERLERPPTVSVVIAAGIVFGVPVREVFPSLYDQVEAKVMQQASILYERLETENDTKSKEKCLLLLNMIQRVPPLDAEV